MALGFFIFYVPVFSFLFLFPFISNHNLSELNERYEYRIPQNARGRGGNLRALDHFWREEGREARARGGLTGPKGRGGGKWAALPFSFILNCFSLFFLLSLFDSNSNKPQIQTKPSKSYAPSKSEI